MPEPSVEETFEIMLGLRERYEAHHKLRYTDDSLMAAAKYSSQYISDRFLPDKVWCSIAVVQAMGFTLLPVTYNWQANLRSMGQRECILLNPSPTPRFSPFPLFTLCSTNKQAIDLIDEAGSRVRLRHAQLPEEARELDKELRALLKEKDAAVRAQDFEKAGSLRDREMELKSQIAAITSSAKDSARAEMESGEGGGPTVTEQDIANIVAQWTGIPIEKVGPDVALLRRCVASEVERIRPPCPHTERPAPLH